MTDTVAIRPCLPADSAALETLYAAAFPDEDLLPLLRRLLHQQHGELCLVAVADGEPVGHIVFSTCRVTGCADKAALLGPLAVAPTLQRRGIGGALVRAGLGRLKNDGVVRVFVLGDPAYYRRFGFAPESGVSTPYPIPEEWRSAWQFIDLVEGIGALEGGLAVPDPWRHQALWGP
ncbi:MAG: GNAT family N-acetyltransferase [Beijerinckiaceae bacterium]